MNCFCVGIFHKSAFLPKTIYIISTDDQHYLGLVLCNTTIDLIYTCNDLNIFVQF